MAFLEPAQKQPHVHQAEPVLVRFSTPVRAQPPATPSSGSGAAAAGSSPGPSVATWQLWLMPQQCHLARRTRARDRAALRRQWVGSATFEYQTADPQLMDPANS